MFELNPDESYAHLNEGMFQTLLRRYPPKKISPHLKEIVYLLMSELLKGELVVSFNKLEPSLIQREGWPESYKKALLESGWVDGQDSPIIIFENQISWRKWHLDMTRLINKLHNKVSINNNFSSKIDNLRVLTTQRKYNVEQLSAIKAISTHDLVLLSGGPGTGKTSTVVGVLEEALSQNPELKIGLSAPTGKATRRLKETIQQNLKQKTKFSQNLANMPCWTLHRWLEAREGGFGKNKTNLIDIDLLVVDEMSMVDLLLMKALIDALKEETKLLLVGDPDQLPPIEIGAVWNELHKAEQLKKFGDAAITLKQKYRNLGDIAELSEVLCKKGSLEFWDKCDNLPRNSNFKKIESDQAGIPSYVIDRLQRNSQELKKLTKQLRPNLINVKEKNQIQEEINKAAQNLFKYVDRLLILCPKRKGIWGVDQIHKQILGEKLGHGISTWPEGTPIMCCSNQPEFDLANGDIGITIGESFNQRLLFRVISNNEKKITFHMLHPSRIKKLLPALAMTIHKAQGSESNEVIVLWPKCNSHYLTNPRSSIKELSLHETSMLYTAITRAKESVHLITTC